MLYSFKYREKSEKEKRNKSFVNREILEKS